jgi:hypothetical protein
MSTKNLARTVLEAGNTPMHQRVRRRQRRAHRHESHAYCHRLTRDPELFFELVPPIAPERRGRDFLWSDELHGDKLGAVHRWLDHQVGRPWADVRSDITCRFDTRTLAGWHVVHQHMLWRIVGHDHIDACWARYLIDEMGMLRHASR